MLKTVQERVKVEQRRLRHATADQRYQISTDGFESYVKTIQDTLADRCDFAQIIKVYANDLEGRATPRRR